MKDDNLYKNAIKNSPYGFAYHKIIYDSKGKPADYVFLEVNKAFQQLTGLKKEEVVDKRATEVLPKLQNNFDWVGIYAEVAATGKRKDFEQYSEPLNRYFHISVFSNETGYFTTLFSDITAEKETSESAHEFLNQSGIEIDYQKISDQLQKLSGAKFVVFNAFDENNRDFTTVSVSGLDQQIEKASELLGFNLRGKHWSYDPYKEEKIKESTITVFDSIAGLAAHTSISDKAIKLLENVLKLGKTIVVKIQTDNFVLGDFTLLLPAGKELQNRNMVEVYAQQVGMLLEKNRARKRIDIVEERMKLAMDAGDHSFWEWDLRTDQTYFSPAYYTMLGYKSGELPMTKETWVNLMHPEDRVVVIPLVKDYISRGEKFELAFRLKCKDGSWKWISGRGKSYRRDEEGSPYRVLGVHVDIDKYVRAREAAKEDKQKLQTILDGIPEIILVMQPDSTVISINKTGNEILKESKDEIIGVKCHDIFEFAKECDDCAIDRVLRSGKPETIEKYIPAVDRWFLTTFIPVTTNDGKTTMIVEKMKDITERKMIESQLRSSEENFRNIIETMDDMIVVADSDGLVFFANKAVENKLGYSLAELEGKHILELHPAEKMGEAELIFADMLQGNRDTCPLPLISSEGKLLPVETRIWFGKWNKQDCIFAIVKDLRKEQELLQKFNKIFDSNPALIAVGSIPDRRFIDVNKSFTENLGYKKEEVIGKTGEELGLFVDIEQYYEAVRIMKEAGQMRNIEMRIRTKSNRILDGLFSGEVIEIQDKIYFLSVITDITARKRAEKELEKQLRMQNILMTISSKYINIPFKKVDMAINEALKELGQFVSADRSYIFYYDFEEYTASNVYEWSADGIDAQIDKLQDVPIEDIPDWINTHQQGEVMEIEDVSGLEDDALRSILETQ
ncbi:MAG: PAS domain S-box protein, partial [Halanaerobiales bacterium]